MARGVDHAARPGDYPAWARAARAAGYTLDLRYLCWLDQPYFDATRRALNAGKLARPAEVRAALEAGLAVGLVWQDTKRDAHGAAGVAGPGYAAGIRNGREAARLADQLGYPAGCVIFAAVADYDAPSSDVGVLAEYCGGFRDGLAGRWLLGGYGKRATLEQLLAAGHVEWMWQSMGWTGGVDSPAAALIQRTGSPSVGGITCDPNDIRVPDLPVWNPGRVPAPAAAPVFVSRSEWDAVAPKSRTVVSPSKRTHFFVHYSTGQELGRIDTAGWVREIQRFHMGPSRGWADIAYNFLVDRVGRIFEGRGWDVVGAHCPDFNTVGIGVCFLGNDDPGYTDATPEARAAIRWLADEANRRCGHQLEWAGHRDHRQTECPGDELEAWVHAGMPLAAAPAPALASEEDDMPNMFTVPVPWQGAQLGQAGRDPYFAVHRQEKPTIVAVASINGAEFTDPPWREGQKTADFEDVVFLNLWWRRFLRTSGPPTGALPFADRVVFTCEGTVGTYTLARRG